MNGKEAADALNAAQDRAERAEIIQAATDAAGGESPADFAASSSKFEGCPDPELAAAFHALCGVSVQDESVGSVCESGFFARFGRYVFSEDTHGFCDVVDFGTVEDAETAMATYAEECEDAE
jgi:hypothetical protein